MAETEVNASFKIVPDQTELDQIERDLRFYPVKVLEVFRRFFTRMAGNRE